MTSRLVSCASALLLFLLGAVPCVDAQITLRAGRGFGPLPETVVPVRFGHAFAAGEIPDWPIVTVEGARFRSQVQVHNRHADGSARFVVVSLVVERVARGAAHRVTFASGSRPNTPAPLHDWPASADPVITYRSGDVAYQVSAKSLFAAGHRRTLLDGPVSTTYEIADHQTGSADVGFGIERAVRPIFHLDVWHGTPFVRVRIATEVTNTESFGAQQYGVTASVSPTQLPRLVEAEDFAHSVATRWSRTDWAGKRPAEFDVVRDPESLVASGLFPRFHRPPRGREIDAFLTAWRKADRTLGGVGLWRKAGGAGGGHPQIAPYPEWEVLALLDGSADLLRLVDENADLAGSYQLHIREGRAGQRFLGRPVCTLDRPTLMLRDLTYHYTAAKDRIVPKGKPLGEAWRMDRAHLPNLYTVPAFLSGDPWHLEGQLFVASWAQAASNGAATNTSIGRGPQGYNGHIPGEPRGQAWALLHRLHAAWLIPSDDPWATHLNDLVLDGLAGEEGPRYAHMAPDSPLAARPVHGWARELHADYERTGKLGRGLPPANELYEGLPNYVHEKAGLKTEGIGLAVAPWQSAFLVYTFWRATVMGWPGERLLAFGAQNIAVHLAHPDLRPSRLDAYTRPTVDTQFQWLERSALLGAWIGPPGRNSNRAYASFTQPAVAASHWALKRGYVPHYAPPCAWFADLPHDVDIWALWSKDGVVDTPLAWSIVP